MLLPFMCPRYTLHIYNHKTGIPIFLKHTWISSCVALHICIMQSMMGLWSYIGQNQLWFSSYRWTHYCNSVKPPHLNLALLGYCCHRSMHVRFSLYLFQIGRKWCQSQSGLYGGEILTDRPLLTSYDGSPRISRMQFASSYYLRDSDVWWSRPLEDKGFVWMLFSALLFRHKSIFVYNNIFQWWRMFG